MPPERVDPILDGVQVPLDLVEQHLSLLELGCERSRLYHSRGEKQRIAEALE